MRLEAHGLFSFLGRAMTDNDKERGCTRKDTPSSFLYRR